MDHLKKCQKNKFQGAKKCNFFLQIIDVFMYLLSLGCPILQVSYFMSFWLADPQWTLLSNNFIIISGKIMKKYFLVN